MERFARTISVVGGDESLLRMGLRREQEVRRRTHKVQMTFEILCKLGQENYEVEQDVDFSKLIFQFYFTLGDTSSRS